MDTKGHCRTRSAIFDDSSDHNVAYDIEKSCHDHDSYDEGDYEIHYSRHGSSYSSSSRETSGSYEPMLRKPSSHHRLRKADFYRPPSRKTIRYLSLALTTTLLVFALSLWRASLVSSRQVELGPIEKQPTQPPAWEAFPFLKRYFGGIRNLVPRDQNSPEYPSDEEPRPSNDTSNHARRQATFPRSTLYDPYALDASEQANARYEERQQCFLDEHDAIAVPRVHYYEGIPDGLPDPVIGSYDVLGLQNDICFERYGRLAPYGYGYSVRRGGSGAGLDGEKEGSSDMWSGVGKIQEVDFRKVRWHETQTSCLKRNKHRFVQPTTRDKKDEHLFTKMNSDKNENTDPSENLRRRSNESLTLDTTAHEQILAEQEQFLRLNRTAIVIRTWWDHEYSLEDIIYLRSMIAELSLLSGGEYTLHFLVHVKDDNVPIWADKQIYDRVLENSLPEEFRGMGTLWSERQMSLIYGGLEESFFRDLPVHGVYRGTYMALQYFSHLHPEYEFVWNWEMDVRNTGHWYHFFDRVRRWTKDQPRKGLWERNGRFYVPSVHGTWEDFKQMVRVQTELGTESPNNIWSGLRGASGGVPGLPRGRTDTPVWGPESPVDMLQDQEDVEPPTMAERDKYEWGVGEEADFITFSPLWDPDGTTWFYVKDVTGYNTSEGLPPRRATIGTSTRLSRRLLQTMHRETVLARHHMFSEMWPASVALHHGYKAVYAPHPVYIDRRWPTAYLAGVMNGGRNGASGGARTSVFGGREHNFKGQSWFYDAGFSPNLWRRWLGYKVDNDGGEQEEKAGEGRMCLPPMLLHPVKSVHLVAEGMKTVEELDLDRSDIVADSELDWDRMK